jgi:Mg-chelatase subunit ChlD
MKSKILLGIFLVLVLIANVSFASYSTVTMSVVEEPVCTIELSKNSKFEKKLISKDLTNKEVTLQLQVTNGEESSKPTGELMLLIDNSNSMTIETSNGKTRKDLVFESAKTLVSNLLADNTKLKIGIASFSTNVDASKEGTLEDASIISPLSNDATALKTAISNIETNGPRTDLQAGLSVATTGFSQEQNNKYLIVLTDGVPNVAINYDKVYYSDDVIAKTKQELQSIGTKGIKVITMLTGVDENTVAQGTTKTYGQIISEIFGTTSAPTTGKFYYVTDTEVEKTITTDIYNELVPISKTLKNIQIVDYFPEEIINNFDFSYVSEANIGDISATVDTTNNSITWTIPELDGGQTATVQYKLKLKENFDSNIVGKILNTNQKVDITYTDINNNPQSKTSDITPKLKLDEPPVELPKAGSTLFIGFATVTFGLLAFSIIKLISIHNKMK